MRTRHGTLLVATLLLSTAVAQPTLVFATSKPPATDPVEVYDMALARLRSLPSAPYLDYVMRQVNRYQDGVIRLAEDEDVRERRGDRASFNLVTSGIPKVNVGRVFIGRHYLIPDAFLPIEQSNSQNQTGLLPDLGQPDGPLNVIATVHSPSNYIISLADVSMLEDCGEAFHLSLTPIRDPDRYNVRDLWIRTTDYMLCKATYNSHLFNDDPRRSHTWLVVTALLNENGFVTSWSSSVTVEAFARLLSTNDVGEYFNITWSNDEPDYYFDQKLWDAHVKALPTPAPTGATPG